MSWLGSAPQRRRRPALTRTNDYGERLTVTHPADPTEPPRLTALCLTAAGTPRTVEDEHVEQRISTLSTDDDPKPARRHLAVGATRVLAGGRAGLIVPRVPDAHRRRAGRGHCGAERLPLAVSDGRPTYPDAPLGPPAACVTYPASRSARVEGSVVVSEGE